jgi:hypothetical protein
MSDDPAPPRPSRPIGFWVKAADDALTRAIDVAPGEHGVSHLEWQAFQFMEKAGPLDLPVLLGRIKPLAPLDEITEILDRFGEMGWLEITTRGPRAIQVFQLSEAGHAQHAQILRRQEEIQHQVADGIAPEEFATAVRVLERLVSNISSADRKAGRLPPS